MADNTLDVRIKQKYDTEANWNSKNPVLLEGEVGYIPDGRFKVGNGTSTWSQLSYNKADPTTHTHTKSQITDFPTSLKNPNALTIQGNGTTLTNGTYDGSVAKTVNITPSSIGAVSTSEFQNQLNKKIDIAQGAENYGKILAINESGNAVTMTAPESTDITYDETKGRLVISSKSNLPGNTGVDPTLSVSGEAADAKVTGMLKSRVDALTSLKEGSTTGDAELQDIRVGSDGTLYSSAGESVRTQISALKSDLAESVLKKVNILKKPIDKGHVVNSSGELVTNANYDTTDYIEVTEGVYAFQTAPTSIGIYDGIGFISGYRDDKTFIGRLGYYSGDASIININSEIKYIKVSVGIKTSECVLIKGDGIPMDNIISGEEKERYKNIKVNCLGDSETQGYLSTEKNMTYPYPNVLKEYLGLEECRNYGLHGTCISYTTGYDGDIENSFVRRYLTMDDDADIIIVMGGTNDFGKGVSLGTISDTGDTTFYGALNVLAEGLINKYPNAKIIYCSMVNNSKSIMSYAEAIEKVARKYGFYYFDVYGSLGINAINKTWKTIDGTHMTQNTVINVFAKSLARFINVNVI